MLPSKFYIGHAVWPKDRKIPEYIVFSTELQDFLSKDLEFNRGMDYQFNSFRWAKSALMQYIRTKGIKNHKIKVSEAIKYEQSARNKQKVR